MGDTLLRLENFSNAKNKWLTSFSLEEKSLTYALPRNVYVVLFAIVEEKEHFPCEEIDLQFQQLLPRISVRMALYVTLEGLLQT